MRNFRTKVTKIDDVITPRGEGLNKIPVCILPHLGWATFAANIKFLFENGWVYNPNPNPNPNPINPNPPFPGANRVSSGGTGITPLQPLQQP